MELKDLIKIDKTLRKPSVVEQVVSQMVDYIESGTLPDNLCILPEPRKFARELGITPTNGCKIYHRLAMYGEYDKDYNLIIDYKGRAIQRFQDSVRYAVKHGVSSCEMLEMIADITKVDNPCTSIPSVPAKSTFWHNCPVCGKYVDDGAADGRCFGCLNAAAKHDTEKQSKHTPK